MGHAEPAAGTVGLLHVSTGLFTLHDDFNYFMYHMCNTTPIIEEKNQLRQIAGCYQYSDHVHINSIMYVWFAGC